MAKILTSKDIIQSVRRRAMVPENTEVYDAEDILEIANEEMSLELLPMLLSLNEEHLVNYVDIPVEEGRNSYPIPTRAIGTKLRDVALVSQGGAQIYELSRISLEQISDYQNSFSGKTQQFVFYIQNNEVVFPSTNGASYPFVRMYYYLRPSELVLNELVGKISSIDRNTGTITLVEFPEDFLNQQLFDFSSSSNPNRLYKYDILISTVDRNTNTVVFDPSSIPLELKVGDFISKAGESAVPQIPVEMHPILAQATAVHILEGLGDTEGLGNARNRLAKMIQGVSGMVNDRVEGAPRKIKQRHSTLIQSTSSNTLRRHRRG